MSATEQQVARELERSGAQPSSAESVVQKALSLQQPLIDSLIEEKSSGLDDGEEMVEIPVEMTPQSSEALFEPVTAEQAAEMTLEESLARISEVDLHVNRIQASVLDIINAIDDNPALLHQWAKSWGELSWLAKGGTGVTLIVPPVLGGLLLSIPGLVVGGSVLAASYGLSWFLLEDLHSNTANHKDRLKQSLGGLTEIFRAVLTSLEQLRHELTVQVRRFQQENIALRANVKELKGQITELSQQVTEMATQNEALADNNAELAEKVHALSKLKTELEADMLGLRAAAEAAQAGMNAMITQHTQDAQQRQSFQERLNDFISGGQTSFAELGKGFERTQMELQQVKSELDRNALQYAALNQQHQLVVDQLESVMKLPAVQAALKQVTGNDLLQRIETLLHHPGVRELEEQVRESERQRDKVLNASTQGGFGFFSGSREPAKGDKLPTAIPVHSF